MRNDTLDPRVIEPNPWNPNVVSHEARLKIRESLNRHGFFRPVLVRELDDGTIQSLGGWHRIGEAIEIGFDEVPVVNLGQISDDRAKEISLLDNAQYGHNDILRLAAMIEELGDVDLVAVMPWTEDDAASLTASLGVDLSKLDLPDAPLGDDDHDPLEPSVTKDPKTHEILRFKVSLADAARARSVFGNIMKDQNFTQADDLTNAGDALMHVLSQGTTDAQA